MGRKRQPVEREAEKRSLETTPSVNAENEKLKAAFEAAIRFAKQVQTPIWVTTDQSTKQSVTYTRFTKEHILQYMQNPTSNEKNLRNASIYMWDASSQYRRLIQYYAGLMRWDYILTPLDIEKKRTKLATFQKQYMKVQNQIELMNLKHELNKAAQIVYRDGVLFGAIWQNKESFFVQRIDPDICSLTSLEDGTWRYSVDMSKIQEKKLSLYPPEFTTMWNAYQNGGNKYQEVPLNITFCLKADETVMTYSIPPWASTLPMLYDIETYKALQETATKIANYKILGMQIPLNDDGTPKVDWDAAEKYYEQLCNVLPPYVGAFVAPMKTEAYGFERSNGTAEVDTVSRAEEQYWFNTGTSALLHGSTVSNTAGALKLAIRADEEIAFALANQVERLINRIIKNMSGTIKFKLRFLPTTIYNQQEQVALYKEAASLGVPGSKSLYGSSLGVHQADIPGMEYLESNMYDMEDWKPLVSGYTGGGKDSGEVGRPASNDEDLDAAGETTRANDENSNR